MPKPSIKHEGFIDSYKIRREMIVHEDHQINARIGFHVPWVVRSLPRVWGPIFLGGLVLTFWPEWLLQQKVEQSTQQAKPMGEQAISK